MSCAQTPSFDDGGHLGHAAIVGGRGVALEAQAELEEVVDDGLLGDLRARERALPRRALLELDALIKEDELRRVEERVDAVAPHHRILTDLVLVVADKELHHDGGAALDARHRRAHDRRELAVRRAQEEDAVHLDKREGARALAPCRVSVKVEEQREALEKARREQTARHQENLRQ